MTVTIQDLEEILEEIKPLNYGRRFMFQKYCEYLVENGQINQCCVEQYTKKEFLYGEATHQQEVSNIRYLINFGINIVTAYGVYRLFKKII